MFIHIGIEKTATTTLQNFLFSRHSQVSYLGRPYNLELQKLVKAVYCDDSILYDSSRWADVAKTEMESISEQRKIIGLSEEFLASWVTRDLGLVAFRLKQLFGPVKIVMTIRNQSELLPSLYADTIKMRPYQPFDCWLEDGLSVDSGEHFRLYDFVTLANYYENVFGADNVGIFVFEEMVTDIEAFSRKLATFLEIDKDEVLSLLRGNSANPRKSGRLVRYKEWRTKFMPGIQLSSLMPSFVNRIFQNFIHGGRPAKIHLSTSDRNRIEAAFSKSNRKLSEMYGLELERFGYPVN